RLGGSWRLPDWAEGPSGPAGHWGVAIAPDGRGAAWGGGKGDVVLVDPGTGRELARLEDPDQDSPAGLLFSPDGTLLIGLSNDSFCVRVYDLRRIRQGLADLGLDWEAPRYRPTPTADTARPVPLQVEVTRQ